MKIVIQTQTRENYGAHDWDGKGECPQYWKFKGGDTFIMEGVTVEQSGCKDFWAKLESLIEVRNESWEEIVIHSDLIDDIDFKLEDHIQEWEIPTYIEYDTLIKRFRGTRIQKNDEFGYMRREIVEKTESFLMGPSQERIDYKCMYLMEDGHRGWSQDFLSDWFACKEAAVA